MLRRCLVHLLSTLHINALDAWMLCLQHDWTANERHLCSLLCTNLGKCKPHLSAAIIANEANGINLLVSWASRDEHFLAGKFLLLSEELLKGFNYLLRLFHTSFTFQFGSKETSSRLDNVVAVTL